MDDTPAALLALAALFVPLMLAWLIVARGDRTETKPKGRRRRWQ